MRLNPSMPTSPSSAPVRLSFTKFQQISCARCGSITNVYPTLLGRTGEREIQRRTTQLGAYVTHHEHAAELDYGNRVAVSLGAGCVGVCTQSVPHPRALSCLV